MKRLAVGSVETVYFALDKARGLPCPPALSSSPWPTVVAVRDVSCIRDTIGSEARFQKMKLVTSS